MTVDERDQWECLIADWSASYGFSISDGETDEHHARRAAAALQEAQ
jgi:hypothetical protein